MKKAFVAVLLAITMLVLTVPAAFADGSTAISENGTYDISTFGNNSTVTIGAGLTVELTNTGGAIYQNMCITCGTGVALTLNGVKINNAATFNACPLSFSGSGNTLTLEDESVLQAGDGQPAVKVEATVSLDITGSGTLNATGGSSSAGIGAGNYSSYHGPVGTIHIISGTVNAAGGRYAAGIGGGSEGAAGTITISGGTVTATGGEQGAGIGGGPITDCGTIVIEGGTVTAKGGQYAAGIGSGYDKGNDKGSITIIDGLVDATGGLRGAGIGSGSYDGSSTIAITIEGGTVTARGGDSGAGIGSGYAITYGDGKIPITIKGGKINATGGNDGAGIGGGMHCPGGTITIQDGQVNATGGAYGAGIGGGYYYPGGMITISGGSVKASGGTYSAGIGGGSYAAGGTIGIQGGTVTTTGGTSAAGIGGGYEGNGGTVTLSGGIIYSQKGNYAPLDIGHGDSETGGTLSITGDAAVFLKTDTCPSPTTSHTHVTVSSVTGGQVYGIDANGWTPPFGVYVIPCTLSYDSNEGEGSAPSLTQHKNTSAKLSSGEELSRQYYHLAGWNTDAEGGGTAYGAGGDFQFTADTTLFAQWEYNTYTVTYAGNGADGGGTADSQHTCTVLAPLATNGFTRSGYAFAGWAESSGGPVKYSDGQSVQDLTAENGGTVKLFAQWIHCAVISPTSAAFDRNPTKQADASATITWNDAASVTDVKSGSVSIGAGNYSVNGITLTVKKEYLALQAVGKLALTVEFNTGTPAALTVSIRDTRSNTITFDSQGGSAVGAKTGVAYNSLIKAPAAPTRTGYTFAGWYKESACANAWNFAKDKVTDNITLWAKWTINTYKVTFNSQGGSAVAAAYAQYNTGVSKPADPTRTGYTFAGWYKEAACATPWDFDKDMVLGNTTIYANWNINYYDVSFDAQGGGKVDAKTHIAYNSTFPAPLIPERTGYTFKGWYKEAALKHAWSFAKDKMPAGNVTLYAKWSVNTFAVSFSSQGGSAINSKTVSYGSLISKPSDPKRTGYAFSGWYKESGCATAWNFGTDTVTAATTLWAKWTVNSYTVTFNAMGGSMTTGSVPADYGTTIALPDAPTKDGFIFAGWYTSAKYTAQWNFATGKVTANITLYAKWSLTAYTVSFNANGGAPAPASQSVPYNGKAIEPTPPAKAGCIFGGWYTSKTSFTGATQWDFDSSVVTGNVTLYARWVTNLGTPSFTVVSTADDRITITFQPMPYVAHYCVSVFSGPDMSHYLYQLDSTSNTLEMTDADPDTVYWFKGWVYTIVDGKTVFGNTTGFVPEGPAKPETLKANAIDYQTVSLTWGGTPYRYTGYEVWRATAQNGKYALVSSPITSTLTDTVSTGTTYWYKVRAYRLNGTTKTYGAFSDAVSAQCILADITDATAVSGGATSVTVSWDAVAGATNYEVWYAPADTGVFKLLTTTASLSCIQTKLVTGQPYYYKVRAYRLVGGKKVYGNFTDVMVATPGV